MTKSELIEKLSMEHEYLNKRDAESVVNLIFNGIGDALSQGRHGDQNSCKSTSQSDQSRQTARSPRAKRFSRMRLRAA